MSEDKKGLGLRFNEGKLRYDLVHPWSHEQMVKILTKGSLKYAERNWELGMKWSNVISSLKRHLAAIEKGEDYDLETGELHAAHLACNAHFLTAYYKIFPEGDDRPHHYLRTPKIALDLDEVIVDFTKGWGELHGENIRPESWNYDIKMRERLASMKELGTLDSFYANLEPKVKPSDVPFEADLYLTSRPVDTEVTKNWLIKNGFPIKKIITVPVGESKVAALKQENIDILIDDGFHNFVEANKAGITCFLMDAPHNQRYNVGYKRIKDFNDFKERFL